MHRLITCIILSLALGGLSSLPANADSVFGITPGQRFCLWDSYANFWDLRIFQPDNGSMLLFGHVHDLARPTSDPCFTQDFLGSGRLYDASQSRAEPLLAEFTLKVDDARPACRSLVATLMGHIDTAPILYTGAVLVNGVQPLPDYLAQLLPDCSEHP